MPPSLIAIPSNDAELTALMGVVASRLMETMPEAVSDPEERQRALLERALMYAAEAEQRIQAQAERIDYLRSLSMTDELTRVFNRRGLMLHLERALAAARRYGHSGAIALADIDNFKSINDRWGHCAGDQALRHMADILSVSLREIDIVGRLGGDEFLMVLMQTSLSGAQKRIRSIQWQLENTGFVFRGDNVPLRASFGVEAFGPDSTAEDLLSRADMAMYFTKNQKPDDRPTIAAE